jgi:hypothetical protein
MPDLVTAAEPVEFGTHRNSSPTLNACIHEALKLEINYLLLKNEKHNLIVYDCLIMPIFLT